MQFNNQLQIGGFLGEVLMHLLKQNVFDSDGFSSFSGGSLAFLKYMYNCFGI